METKGSKVQWQWCHKNSLKTFYRTLTSVSGGDTEELCWSIFFWPSSHFWSGRNLLRKSTGRGKMIVEFFSAEIEVSVCKYRSWRAEGDSEIISAASFRARDAFISPSAAMTYDINRLGVKSAESNLWLRDLTDSLLTETLIFCTSHQVIIFFIRATTNSQRYISLWLWRWLPHKLSRLTTVLFRTTCTFIQMIIIQPFYYEISIC